VLEALEPLLPVDECWAKVAEERRSAATQRLESRIKHLVPTEPERGMFWSLRQFYLLTKDTPKRVKERRDCVKKCYFCVGFSGLDRNSVVFKRYRDAGWHVEYRIKCVESESLESRATT
jgi:hypothetical protein